MPCTPNLIASLASDQPAFEEFPVTARTDMWAADGAFLAAERLGCPARGAAASVCWSSTMSQSMSAASPSRA